MFLASQNLPRETPDIGGSPPLKEQEGEYVTPLQCEICDSPRKKLSKYVFHFAYSTLSRAQGRLKLANQERKGQSTPRENIRAWYTF